MSRIFMEDKKISVVIRKFYDSLHYLYLLDKLKLELPFMLQENIGTGRNLIEKIEVLSIEEWNCDGRNLIEKIEVLSIEEWNCDANYGKYPIYPISSTENERE